MDHLQLYSGDCVKCVTVLCFTGSLDEGQPGSCSPRSVVKVITNFIVAAGGALLAAGHSCPASKIIHFK